MANIYTFNPNEPEEEFDKNNSNYQLASVSYVCSLIKKLINVFEEHINNSTVHQNNSIIREKININMSESIDTCELDIKPNLFLHAKDINTDPSHRFISDDELDMIKCKPSITDINNAISNLRDEFKSAIESTYINLLNTPDVLQKLKNIAYMLKSNPELNNIASLLAFKTNNDEFKEHINSDLHLNDNDRTALDLLNILIEIGCADWKAGKDSLNYIKNKPDSLPANGGNADTIGGYSVNDIMNCQTEEYIYGMKNELHPEKNANECIPNSEYIDEHITMICNHGKGLFTFKTGEYHFNSIDCIIPHDKGITIQGSNNRSTIFIGNTVRCDGMICIKDLTISSASVYIESLCILDNIYFNNCKVYLDACNEATIKNCIFKDCIIKFNDTCLNTIIIANRFINSGKPQHYNISNLFINNLFY